MATIASRHMESADSAASSKPMSKSSSFLKKLNSLTQGDKQFFDDDEEVSIKDLNQQLDVGSERERLAAMKRLLAMSSKGRDVSEAFPQVVKCVVSKNVETRKLVYMFLVHFAEAQPDAALLAINSLQKAMNDTNPHLRAAALRCMSNIRVKDIAQIIVLAVQKGAKDLSPYVRRTAAYAVPKIFRLDSRHTETCCDIIASLLADQSTMVIGAAAEAFLAVCPDRLEMIHPVFRHICSLLPDIDEWGQISVANLLLRYGRTQFVNPDPLVQKALREKREREMKEKEEQMTEEEKEALKKEKEEKEKAKAQTDDEIFGSFDTDKSKEEKKEEMEDDTVASLDADHRLLLQSTLCLLQSRNAATVLAAAVLHFYMAPPAEVPRIVKPLVRLLHLNAETQFIALANAASMTEVYPHLFSENIDEFFVYGFEALETRILKLEILTRSANETNIHRILGEFTHYAKDEDKSFVAAAVQAIGRVAVALPEVSDQCMRQLVRLMVSSPSQVVVAESIIVVKRLLQLNAAAAAEGAEKAQEQDKEKDQETAEAIAARDTRIIKQLARMLIENSVTVPQARAAIIWLVGEYSNRIPERAPDVLRCLARSFCEEAEIAKLQVLSLGAKLVLAPEPESKVAPRVSEILAYVLELAKVDQNYDVRDRARLVRRLLFPEEGKEKKELREAAKELFLHEKPVPAFDVNADIVTQFRLGTLSHIIKEAANGYEPVPDFPEEMPNPDARNPKKEEKPEEEGEDVVEGEEKEDDGYGFDGEEGLGDEDDGWGEGWDEELSKSQGEKKEGEGDDDGWGMGDNGGEYEDVDDWGLGDDKKEEKKETEKEEDDWGLGGEEKKETEQPQEEKKDDDEGLFGAEDAKLEAMLNAAEPIDEGGAFGDDLVSAADKENGETSATVEEGEADE